MENELIDNPESESEVKPVGIFLVVLVVILLLSFGAGVLLSFIKIRTILYTGPLVFGLSLIVLVVALIKKNKLSILAGGGSASFVLFLLGFIYFFRISPRSAEGIVPYFAVLGFFGVLVISILMFIQNTQR